MNVTEFNLKENDTKSTIKIL